MQYKSTGGFEVHMFIALICENLATGTVSLPQLAEHPSANALRWPFQLADDALLNAVHLGRLS